MVIGGYCGAVCRAPWRYSLLLFMIHGPVQIGLRITREDGLGRPAACQDVTRLARLRRRHASRRHARGGVRTYFRPARHASVVVAMRAKSALQAKLESRALWKTESISPTWLACAFPAIWDRAHACSAVRVDKD